MSHTSLVPPTRTTQRQRLILQYDPSNIDIKFLHRDCNVFGFLIGIDVYKSSRIPRLSGAVADVQEVLKFFCDTLHVPQDNFTVLRNNLATRKAIIDTLIHLKDDVRIRHGDAIFIYFSGHGSEIPAPLGWEAGGRGVNIQVIIPHDYCVTGSEEVQAIPDRTIGALLECIAEKKGNNITVVFDCSYSVSGTRALIGSNSAVGVRQFDCQLRGNRLWSLSLPQLFISRSYVLLTACKEGEVAKEKDARGAFTKALLVALQGDITEMTYSDILDNVDPLPGQNPQCEGVHQNRYIFCPDDLAPCPILYTPLCHWNSDLDNHYYTLDAGSARGLAIGDEFTIYPSLDTIGKWNAGLLIIDTIDNFSATLTLPAGVQKLDNFTSFSVAVKSRRGPYGILKLALPPCQDNSLDLLRYCGDELRNVIIASDNPHLTVVEANDADKLVVQVTDPRVTEHGPAASFRNGATIMLEEMPQILTHALDYQWELDRMNSSRPLRYGIEVEFYELHYTKSQYFSDQYDYSPIDSNNLYENGAIHIETGNGTHGTYGIKITNKTPHGIYLQACYFNPESLSIDSVYDPPSGRAEPAVPLSQGGGIFTIGYSSGSWRPFTPPKLCEGQTIHVGFLKLFFFTQFVSSEQQIRSTRPYASRGVKSRSRQAHTTTPHPLSIWDAIVIPVVQHLNLTGHTLHSLPLASQ